jgi:SAM-dependent methyltransferase
MSGYTPTPIHEAVRRHYGSLAEAQDACCGPSDGRDCCTPLYPADQLVELPDTVTGLALGCGDPVTHSAIQPGEVVLDLGSGGGIDCFLAARRVGPAGRVIGIDMTEAMLRRARANAARLNAANVEFRQGQIEALPVADGSVDTVISNCVINLSPDKPRVFAEIFRALRPGGRVSVSDIVTDGALAPEVARDLESWSACVAGALTVAEYADGLSAARLVRRPRRGSRSRP